MKRISLAFFAALPALAQGFLGVGLDLTRVQTITGTVSAVHMVYGAQYPTITVNQLTIKTAPVWFFESHDFELQAGDPIQILAAPSKRANDPTLYAVGITNTETGAVIRLRDDNGVPLWAGFQRMGTRQQMGFGSQGVCPR